jgi:hypothetical protein
MRTLLFAAGLLLALSAQARAQTYTIKFKDYPDAGQSIRVRDRQKGVTAVKVTDAAGKVVNDQKIDNSSEEDYTLTVLAKSGKHLKKYKRAYTKAERHLGKKVQTRPYEGRTVLFEEKDGKYQVRAEGKPELKPADLADLVRLANDKKAEGLTERLVPKKPVKVGGTWEITGKGLQQLASVFGDADTSKCKAEGKLVKAYKKDGKQFGVVEIDLSLALKEVKGMTFDPGKITVTLDGCIDGSSPTGTMTVAGKITGHQAVEKGGMKLTVNTSTTLSITQENLPGAKE